MKKYVFLAACGLLLAACYKADTTDGPAPVAAGFDQAFTLQYRQEAELPLRQSPELTIGLADLSYSFCPPNAMCFAPDFVAPTLRITDAQGLTREVKMPAFGHEPRNQGWIDSTSIRANSRRYVLYYTSWNTSWNRRKATSSTWITSKNSINSQKQGITVQLRVAKPN
ncbi:hypothetical protein ACFQT0_22420 [Hymenobacter humi]|uniref:Lipoprotein n=1 Tax=Hymenobacter humi TaxID=1411620 RepID=A0ABW2U8J3_9BACT